MQVRTSFFPILFVDSLARRYNRLCDPELVEERDEALLLMCSIGRLSAQRAGTRYNRRGVDRGTGVTANFAETTQVVCTRTGKMATLARLRLPSLRTRFCGAPSLLLGPTSRFDIEASSSFGPYKRSVRSPVTPFFAQLVVRQAVQRDSLH